MNKYFEIYVAGKNGYSIHVGTNKPLTKNFELEILELAEKAKIIDGGDAKDVSNGEGYVQEISETEAKDFTINEI